MAKRFRGYYRRGGFYGRKPVYKERKFFDTVRAPNTPGATGTIFSPSLCLVPQGAGESQRIGRSINISSLHINFVLGLSSSGVVTASRDIYRVIVYQDKQCNGATATAAQILDTAGVVDFMSFRNLENSGRFRVLKDKRMTISANGQLGGGNLEKFQHASVNVKCSIPVEFSGATGGLVEIRSNNIGVLIVSTAASANCFISYIARIRYTG